MRVFASERSFARQPDAVSGAVRLVAPDGVEVIFEGVATSAWPAQWPSLAIELEREVAGQQHLVLSSGGDRYAVVVTAWRAHEPRRELYEASLARFEPSAGERRLARLLVAILAAPVAARLFMLWHRVSSRSLG